MLSFYFLLFLTVFFIIPVQIENARLKLALFIPTGDPIIVANAIEILPVDTDKTISYYHHRQNKEYIY